MDPRNDRPEPHLLTFPLYGVQSLWEATAARRGASAGISHRKDVNENGICIPGYPQQLVGHKYDCERFRSETSQ